MNKLKELNGRRLDGLHILQTRVAGLLLPYYADISFVIILYAPLNKIHFFIITLVNFGINFLVLLNWIELNDFISISFCIMNFLLRPYSQNH